MITKYGRVIKFEVGDMVRVRKDLIVGKYYGKFYLGKEWEKFKGMTAKITRVDADDTYLLNIGEDKSSHWWTNEMLEPTNIPTPTPPFYVDCPTREIWDMVEAGMFKLGYEWNGGKRKGTDWDVYEINSAMSVGKDKVMMYCEMEYYKTHNEDNEYGNHILYKMFLGILGVEEPIDKKIEKIWKKFLKVKNDLKNIKIK